MGTQGFHLGTEVVESGNLVLDRDGIESFILFGLTVRSINSTLGLAGSDSSITVSLVQEEGQIFEFNTGEFTSNGIDRAVELSFGKYHLHGIVESWQETIVSIQGSGIFEVKLKGAQNFLSAISFSEQIDDLSENAAATKLLFDIKIGGSPDPISVGDSFVDTVSPENIIDLPAKLVRDFDKTGIRFDIVMDAIENILLEFTGIKYKINMQEIRDLINSRTGNPGDQDSTYRISVLNNNLSQLLDTLSRDLNFQWWVTVGEKGSIEVPEIIDTTGKIIQEASTVDFTFLDIQIIDMTLDAIPGQLSMEGLKDLHGGHVISQKKGFDGLRLGFSSFILNGPKRETLIEHSGSKFRQFWGWEHDSFEAIPIPDEPIFPEKIGLNFKAQTGISLQQEGSFVEGPLTTPTEPFAEQPIYDDTSDIFRTDFDPLESPAFHLPGTPDGERFETSIEEMKSAINGDLNGVLAEETLEAIIKYANQFWGRVFYLPIPEEDWDNSNFGAWTTPIKAGWWEGNASGDVYPGTLGQDPNTERARFLLENYVNIDGRWNNFCKIPSLDFDLDRVEWRFPAQQGGFNFSRFGERFTPSEEVYVPFQVVRRGHFMLIVLDVALRFRTGDPFSDAGTTLDLFSDLDDAKIWMAESDTRLRYGPWSSFDGLPEDERPGGRTKIITDQVLTPWIEGFRGITNNEGFTTLNNIARARVNRFKPTRTIAENGTLEIAGLPEANLGDRLGFILIKKIDIAFGINGIKTRYDFSRLEKNVTLSTQEAEEEKIAQDEDDKQDEQDDKLEEEENLIELDDDFNDNIIPDDEIPEEFEILEQENLAVIIDKPEGGKGRIVSRGIEGPFYNISRLNARELKEGFGAAMDLAFVTEWNGVRNVAENDSSPGLLPIGQIVNVSIYVDLIGGAEAFIEITPPAFGVPQG